MQPSNKFQGYQAALIFTIGTKFKSVSKNEGKVSIKTYCNKPIIHPTIKMATIVAQESSLII